MINTVIFDLDGLLVNTETTWYQVWNEILGEFGKSFTLDDYVKNYSGKTIVDNINLLIENFSLPMDTDTGVRMAVETEARYVEKGVELKEGARELLTYLKEKNYKVVLGTSSALDRALAILRSNDAVGYFDGIVTGYDVKRSKPFPDVFLAAAQKMESEPGECLVLEDSEAGIQAAYDAGIPVICVPDLKTPGEHYIRMTAAVMESLHEVIRYLNEKEQM